MKNTKLSIIALIIILITFTFIVVLVTAQNKNIIESSEYFNFRTHKAIGNSITYPKIWYLNQNIRNNINSNNNVNMPLGPYTVSITCAGGMCPNDISFENTCNFGGACISNTVDDLTCLNQYTCNQITCNGITCSGISCIGQGTCSGPTCSKTCGNTCDGSPICDRTSDGWYTCDGNPQTCDGKDTCDGDPDDPHTCYGYTCHYTCKGGDTCDGTPGCNGTHTQDKEPTCDGTSPTCEGGHTCDGTGTCTGHYTCSGLTCDRSSTCDGSGTCDGQFTCEGSTCNQAGTCNGYTCEWICGETCKGTCSGWTSCGETCSGHTCDSTCWQTACGTCYGQTCEGTCDGYCPATYYGITCDTTCTQYCDPCDECGEGEEVWILVDEYHTFESPCPEGNITWRTYPYDVLLGYGNSLTINWSTSGKIEIRCYWKDEGCTDYAVFLVNVVEADLTIYNGGADLDNGDNQGPQGFNVYDSEEESLGAYLLVNWDDDDGDGNFLVWEDQWQTYPIPDLYENSVEDEDNLAKLVPSLNPFLDEGTITLEVTSGEDKIRLWKYSSKGEELPLSMSWNLANEQQRMEFWEFQMYGLWIEGIEYSGSERDVTIQLTYNGPVSCKDTVKATVVMMNLGNAVYRDNLVDFPPGIDKLRGHTAIVYKYCSICTKDELCKDINFKIAEMQGPTLNKGLNTITEFVPGEGPTTPRGCYTNPSITYQQRLMIIYITKVLGSRTIGYTPFYVLKPLDTWNGRLSTITHLRCDGFVEVVYEFNGVEAWGRERWYNGFMYGVNYDITAQGDNWNFWHNTTGRHWAPGSNSGFDNQEEHNEYCGPWIQLPEWAEMIQPATQAGYITPTGGAHTKFEFQVLCRPIGSTGSGNNP